MIDTRGLTWEFRRTDNHLFYVDIRPGRQRKEIRTYATRFVVKN